MPRSRLCPTCGEDAPTHSEYFDPFARVWTGFQTCPTCKDSRIYTRQAETPEEREMAKRAGTPHRVNTIKGNGARSESRQVAPAKREPRNKPLPGMEDVRINALDEVCASIGETREEMNTLRTTEGEHLRTALGLMRKHNKTTWRAAGVELARVPGEEKLRVRTSKEKATAETDDDDLEAAEA